MALATRAQRLVETPLGHVTWGHREGKNTGDLLEVHTKIMMKHHGTS